MPDASRLPRFLVLAAVALAILCAAGLAGAGIGAAYRQWRAQAFFRAAEDFRWNDDAAACEQTLGMLQTQRAALGRHPAARAVMARVYLHAASLLPAPRPCYEAALAEIEEALRLTDPRFHATYPGFAFEARSSKIAALQELGRDAAALAEIRILEKAISDLPEALRPAVQVNCENALAYLLASAAAPSVRNPAEALTLAKRMIQAPVLLPDGRMPSNSAALLDTLAEAHHAAGQSARAVEIQRSALALADGQDLEIYLRHDDADRAGAEAKEKGEFPAEMPGGSRSPGEAESGK
jgi:hypothetical protein